MIRNDKNEVSDHLMKLKPDIRFIWNEESPLYHPILEGRTVELQYDNHCDVSIRRDEEKYSFDTIY